MKKTLIGLSALVILSFAVLLFVNAKSVTFKTKKACTESVVKCAEASDCTGVKCEKAGTADCDPATCPKGKDCPKAKEDCKMQAASTGCQKTCPMAVK